MLGLARTLRAAYSAHTQETLRTPEPTLQWIIRHAVWILNRHGGSHGQPSPHSRARRFDGTSPLVEFGENVYALLPDERVGGPMVVPKLASRWVLGVWVGKTDRTNEHLVSVNGDIQRFRTIRRFTSHGRRWARGPWSVVKGVPGRPVVSDRRTMARQRRDKTPGCFGCWQGGKTKHARHCRYRGGDGFPPLHVALRITPPEGPDPENRKTFLVFRW